MIPLCPLCSAGSPLPYREEAGHRYLRCGRCGFVFLFPTPSPAEIEALYQKEAGTTFHHGTGIRETYEKRLEARLRLRVVWPVLRTAPDRSALEIGCGAGYLLDHLRRAGWSTAGTEAAEIYVEFARRMLGLEVGREPPRGRRFGAILLFDVLSHLTDPAARLAEFRHLLRPGGVLVLETGNAAELDPTRAGPLGAPEHTGHFTEGCLRELLTRLGYREVRIRRFNVEWQRQALARLGRRRGPARAAPPGGPGLLRPPPTSLAKRLGSHLLLGLRFGLGRLGADRRHACTLFVTGRR